MYLDIKIYRDHIARLLADWQNLTESERAIFREAVESYDALEKLVVEKYGGPEVKPPDLFVD